MTRNIHTLLPGVTTRDVNRVIRDAIDSMLSRWGHETYMRSDTGHMYGPYTVAGDERLDRYRKYTAPGVRSDVVTRTYVFGVHTDLRSTLIASHEVGSGEVALCFPARYKGWDGADSYTRLLVSIRDRILYSGGIIDRSIAAR